jgi:hypothetical protein
LWDSHPLALGATPAQVFIDGIPQLDSPPVVQKPRSFQKPPKVPNFVREAKEAVEYEGLPPLQPSRADSDILVFENVKGLFLLTTKGIQNVMSAPNQPSGGVVVVRNGSILCSGIQASCLKSAETETQTVLDLKGEILDSDQPGSETD